MVAGPTQSTTVPDGCQDPKNLPSPEVVLDAVLFELGAPKPIGPWKTGSNGAFKMAQIFGVC